MKKLTALFLALVMTLSLCTVTAFAADYATVGDILANITNLPQKTGQDIPAEAWKDSTSEKCCYKVSDGIQFFPGSGLKFTFPANKSVNKEGNKYTAINTYDLGQGPLEDKVEFTMLGNKVVSITFSTTATSNKRYEGTYYGPVTIADILDTAEGGFPTNEEDAWFTEDGNAWLYVAYGCIMFYGNGFVNDGIDCNYQVTQNDQGNYVAIVARTTDTVTVTFNMKNDELVSVIFNTTIQGNASLNGTYAPVVTHTVNIATPTNGTVTATPTDVASGTDVTLTVTPNAGYKTKSVSVTTAGGANVTVTGSSNTYSFVMPNDNVTVKAVFEKENSGTGGGHHHGGGTATVQSAKTADMGVALYGVLSVSSLLGMGWVSKKKKQ